MRSVDHSRWTMRFTWFNFLCFHAIVANIPFWVASHLLGLLPIGWVCLEYAAVGLLALVLPGPLAGIACFVIIAADIAGAVSKTYALGPLECIKNASAINQFSHPRTIDIYIVGAIVVVFSVIASSVRINNKKHSRKLAGIALLAFIVTGVTGDYLFICREAGQLINPFHGDRPSDEDRFTNYSSLWLGRYPSVRLVRDEEMFGLRGKGDTARYKGAPMASASAIALRLAGVFSGHRDSQLPNFVLVLVESWGMETDPATRMALTKSYNQPEVLARYHVSEGVVPFVGATVGGETRELCGENIGFGIEELPASSMVRCLPKAFETLGYSTVALHGMDGAMFNRVSWYRSMGFEDQWFRPRFRSAGLPACVGAYDGICDASIGTWIQARLQNRESKPDFVYWVTLNSHLPIPPPIADSTDLQCSAIPSLVRFSALCSWFQLVSIVHESVAHIAMSNLSRDTVFVVVGDHAPPFVNSGLRSQFSSSDVPYIILVPRTREGTSKND